MRSERFDFPNAKGEKLSALLDSPLGPPMALAEHGVGLADPGSRAEVDPKSSSLHGVPPVVGW